MDQACCAKHLESGARETSPTYSLRDSGRRPLSRSSTLGSPSPSLLFATSRTQPRLPRQVRCWLETTPSQLVLSGALQPLRQKQAFASSCVLCFGKNGLPQPPFGSPQHVLRYLAAYTHRVAISNHRLVAFQHDQVTFRWKDYAHGNKKRMMTLSSQEFLRRFLLHVLPRGVVRIRFYGFLAQRRRGHLLSICRQLLQQSSQPLSGPQLVATSSSPPTLPTMFIATAYS